jgi:hypothetical protein
MEPPPPGERAAQSRELTAAQDGGAAEPCRSTAPHVCQLACKPGSVWRALAHVTAIPLERPLPDASSNLPGRLAWKPAGTEVPRRPYSVLLPVGFTVPVPLPVPRWALTPPFHPYPASPFRALPGGLLSVALSLGSPPPAVSRHRVSVEPGLSSPAAFRPLPERPSGRLTRREMALPRWQVKWRQEAWR